ncbi:uncharacterized protein LOC113510812 isoform X2 [Galleria mellonella]|uniref:Uncharacterized protein LOC113510812 isoform X2 n=1 Tax=Galleria mellonella TaxID=7137 RepID=A0A6J1WB61_GALME|nr:uncharacterized protein LOC113510812 isoform X2 [Galleria mellonella]
MKESYSEDIMLCFVQGFGNGDGYKNRDITEGNVSDSIKLKNKKKQGKRISLPATINSELVELRDRKSRGLVTGKSLRLSSGERLPQLTDIKRSFSDRFSVITDGTGRRSARGFLTIRKTWSTGNFAAGAAGGGCGAPRSAPATPLQLEPHPRTKHDKQTLKPLSGSAPSVRVGALNANTNDTAEGKQPSKARQKKFMRHFPQVGPEERVLNYYSCALVGDLLLQGHLYITKNYFAFYSNVFGYVTKLLIPTSSVLRISKEKVARIIPNAVGVCTRDERHVFGSLLSRDSTYKLMMHVWKAARPELATPKPQDARISEVDLDASEYSPEDDSSSGAGENHDPPSPPVRRDSESGACATVIQPALLTGGVVGVVGVGAAAGTVAGCGRARGAGACWRVLLVAATALLAITAALLSYKLYLVKLHPQEELSKLSGEEMYSELMRWRTRLHGRAANELHAFLTTNLLLLTKVRQSLETLSGVILTDMAHGSPLNVDMPNETVFS